MLADELFLQGVRSLASTLSAARLGVGPTLGFTRHEQETKGGRLSRPPFSSVCRSAKAYGSFVALQEAPQTSARSRFGSEASVQFVFGLFFAAGIR